MALGFTAVVSAITDAFGDPTRRKIYLYLRRLAEESTEESSERSSGECSATAAAVAAEVGIHANVARHHLDKLAAGGYVEVLARDAESGERRAGRPSKRYVAVEADLSELPPVHADELVLALLGQALARLPRAEAAAMAEDVGATYGRALATGLIGDAASSSGIAVGQRSLRSAMQAVAAALTAHGFAARTADNGRDDHRLRIINDHCPFGSLAIDHPVLCAVDRGLVRGMLGAIYPDGDNLDVDVTSSKARGDTFCATAV